MDKKETKWLSFENQKEPKYLVNYTSRENGFIILEGEKILFKNLLATNDPRDYNICSRKSICNEPSFDYYPKLYEDWEPFAENHLFAYYLSNFKKENKFEENGYDNSVRNVLLWAHYGDSQKGMCFVYNTEKLKKLCSSTFQKSAIAPIFYCITDQELTIPIEVQTANNHNDKMANYIFNSNEINNFHFFHKHESWIYENEIRILAYHKDKVCNDQVFVDIKDCIEAVVLGDQFDIEDCQLYKIKPILKKRKIKLKQVKYKMKRLAVEPHEIYDIKDIDLD